MFKSGFYLLIKLGIWRCSNERFCFTCGPHGVAHTVWPTRCGSNCEGHRKGPCFHGLQFGLIRDSVFFTRVMSAIVIVMTGSPNALLNSLLLTFWLKVDRFHVPEFMEVRP